MFQIMDFHLSGNDKTPVHCQTVIPAKAGIQFSGTSAASGDHF